MTGPFSLPLSVYRVLDLSNERGWLCGRILGDLGADVIKVEPPGGDPSRMHPPYVHDEPHPEKSLSWYAYNYNKRSITLDITRPQGRDRFLRLAQTAAFVVETSAPGYLDSMGLGYRTLQKVNPTLVITSITPFGQTGPYRDYQADDLVACAAGGLMHLCGDAGREPLRIGIPQAAMLAGAQAAAGAMIAHYGRLGTGRGAHVDVSVQEAVASALTQTQQLWFVDRQTEHRGARHAYGGRMTRGTFPARDGYVASHIFWGVGPGTRMRGLARWMRESGQDTSLAEVDFTKVTGFSITQEQVDGWEAEMDRFFSRFTKAEVYREALKRRAFVYPVSTPRDLAADPQLRSRGFFQQVEHPELGATLDYPGPFCRWSETPMTIRRRPPRVGEHNGEVSADPLPTAHPDPVEGRAADGPPLSGIKVADFSWAFAGPMATKYLALYGAQVVKIETHSRPDSTRVSPPFLGKPSRNSSAVFANFAPSKMSISLNLNMPEARDVAKRLAAWADVAVENFSAGQMADWGLDYESLRQVNPRLVMLSSSQQGQTGPHAAHPGLGGMLQALAGFNHFTGYRDGAPMGPALPYPDVIAPWFSIVAILAALEHRDRTGRGQHLDLSQLEASLQFLAPALLDYSANGREGTRRGNGSGEAAPHNAYRCKGDDRWCAISVGAEVQWRAFRRVVGGPSWSREPRFATLGARLANVEALDALVTEWTRQREAEDVMRLMQEAGVPAGVVANGRDLHEDRQLRHRGHFMMVEGHPRMGPHPVDAPAFRIEGSPPEARPAPLLGQHNETVCRGLLGMHEEEFQALEAKGIFS